MITRFIQSARLLSPIVFMLVLLGACGDDAPNLRPLDHDAVILAFGDSLTAGTGANPDESYPVRLAELTGRTVINAGVSGELSADGRRRLPGLLARHQPELVILCHGGNDILRQRDYEHIAANLRAMIETIRAHDSDVLLVAVPEPGLFPGAAAVYAEVATATGTPLESDALARILGKSSLKADTVHPNRAGYAELADAIAARLRAGGALQ